MATKDDLCKTCGNPKSSSSGSMSSYVRLCNCDLKLESSDNPVIQLCKNCGKRVGKGRDGSITQFVFRSDTCSCDSPEILDSSESFDEYKSKAFKGFDESTDDEKEEELSLNSKQFPVERYKAIKLLGKGGFSSVYLARDKLLNKKVAIKVLHVVESQLLIMFQDEARATSKLKHPNIIEILDFGATEEGAPYMTLEYFPSVTAESLLNSTGPFSWTEAINVVQQVAHALSYAHEQKIFHRDLKPSNILISKNDDEILQAKLIDFGIASVQESTGKLTEYQGKTLAGTPHYMCPDLIQNLRYTEASEIYSLGCVLYELVTGQPVFTGETALDILAQHSNSSVPPINEIANQSIPLELELVINKCLNKNPDDRFQTMKDLILNLSFENSESEYPQEVSITRRRNYTKFSIFAAIILGISSMTFLAYSSLEHKKPDTPNAVSVKEKFSLEDKEELQDSFSAFSKSYESKPSKSKTNISDNKTNFRVKILESNGYQKWIVCNPLKIRDKDLKELREGKLPIREVDLSNAKITDAGLAHLVGLKLLGLSLANTLITDKAGIYIKQIKSLSHLNVSESNFGDLGLKKLSNKRLNSLLLADCRNISDKGLKLIVEKWPNLERLNLSYNRLSKKGLLELGKLKNLKVLELSNLPISSKLAKILKETSIEQLNLALCKIKEKDLNTITEMQSLRVLVAMKTVPRLKTWIANTNARNPQLKILDTPNLNASIFTEFDQLSEYTDFLNTKGLDY